MTREEFIKRYGAIAKIATQGTGIFPETLLAQAILESSKNGEVGASELASLYNNYFGIKADKSWKGRSVNMKTGEFTGTSAATTIKDNFRVYDSPEDSIKDYVLFLKQNKRYSTAGVFDAKNPQEQGELLQKAGYATGAEYGKTVGSIASKVSEWLSEVKDVADVAVQQTKKIIVENRTPIILGGVFLILAGLLLFYYYKTQIQHGK